MNYQKTVTGFLAILAAIVLLASCSGDEGGYPYTPQVCTDQAAAFGASAGSGTSATNWLYQLQNADPVAIGATGFDIVTMDYSLDGSDEGAYTPAEIEGLTTAGKTVLAYLSIGEAEDYRFYFDPDWIAPGGSGLDVPTSAAPCWLGRTNAEWEGNFKVQYWSEAWQGVVLAYLDKIVDAGFSGVYLDIIDGFYYWSESHGEGVQLDEAEAAARMINLVNRIALHARVTREVTDFLVFPQNGEEILTYDLDGGFLNTVNGFGIEDLYYDETTAISATETALRTGHLNAVVGAGKLVLVADYVDDGSGSGANTNRITDFRNRASAANYVPYAARSDRELDVINEIPGVQPP